MTIGFESNVYICVDFRKNERMVKEWNRIEKNALYRKWIDKYD